MSDNVNHPKHYEFQSTLSMRRATGHAQRSARPRPISIHALHEESDGCFRRHRLAVHISIHALHEESDSMVRNGHLSDLIFQSTLSMRRATSNVANCRTPRRRFQSTLSMRRATFK